MSTPSFHHNSTYSLPDPFFNPQVSFIAPGFLETDNPTHTSPPNLLSISWSAGGVRNCARYAVCRFWGRAREVNKKLKKRHMKCCTRLFDLASKLTLGIRSYRRSGPRQENCYSKKMMASCDGHADCWWFFILFVSTLMIGEKWMDVRPREMEWSLDVWWFGGT